MFKSTVLVFGSSHLGCISLAYAKRNPSEFQNHYSFKSFMDYGWRSRIVTSEEGEFIDALLKADVEGWLHHYDTERPHGSLCCKPACSWSLHPNGTMADAYATPTSFDAAPAPRSPLNQ